MLFIFQYDNAVLFCDLGGMPLLVKGLNDTDSSLRSLSAYALGSAVQRYENKYNVSLHEFYIMHDCDRMVVRFTTIYAITTESCLW